ncbi:MAG: histone deacetylase family protein [Alphaproteobacteria bacterium]|nr:histone deacetylase family protein [Alphaproteobacteria bacterium]
MVTFLYYHPACEEHCNGRDHPEAGGRLAAIMSGLKHADFDGLVRKKAPGISEEKLLYAHSKEYVQRIFSVIADEGNAFIDGDTLVSAKSPEAARRAAGSVVAAIDDVCSKELLDKQDVFNAFCAIRPPGHHAKSNKAMGFCLFNNVAIGALYAQKQYDLKRIAIIDFDVHHGNGTQDIIKSNPNILYISSHQKDSFPWTGHPSNVGKYGNILNVVLSLGEGAYEFRIKYEEKIFPVLENFSPELIIISAGFDAHKDDPLAGLCLTTDDFYWVTKRLVAISKRHSKGRIVSVLEGGYNLNALKKSVAAHVRALMQK